MCDSLTAWDIFWMAFAGFAGIAAASVVAAFCLAGLAALLDR